MSKKWSRFRVILLRHMVLATFIIGVSHVLLALSGHYPEAATPLHLPRQADIAIPALIVLFISRFFPVSMEHHLHIKRLVSWCAMTWCVAALCGWTLPSQGIWMVALILTAPSVLVTQVSAEHTERDVGAWTGSAYGLGIAAGWPYMVAVLFGGEVLSSSFALAVTIVNHRFGLPAFWRWMSARDYDTPS